MPTAMTHRRTGADSGALGDIGSDDDIERRLDRLEDMFVLLAQIVAGGRDIGRLTTMVGAGPMSAGSLGDRVGRPFVDHVMAIQNEREARRS